MQCLFCNTERDGQIIDGRAYICGTCAQTLIDLSQKQLKEAHDHAVSKGYENKAKAIESFMENEHDRKTENTQRNMVRKRPGRAVRPSSDRIRAKQAALQLDTGRVKIR
jgi:hypothetical protein